MARVFGANRAANKTAKELVFPHLVSYSLLSFHTEMLMKLHEMR